MRNPIWMAAACVLALGCAVPVANEGEEDAQPTTFDAAPDHHAADAHADAPVNDLDAAVDEDDAAPDDEDAAPPEDAATTTKDASPILLKDGGGPKDGGIKEAGGGTKDGSALDATNS